MQKPRIGFYWCSGCGGCEESILDLAEGLLDVASAVDIAFWPVAMDFKYSDVLALDDGELACCFINGSIRMQEQAEIARLLRRKSRLIMAHGACAHLGGVPGLANLTTTHDIIDTAYRNAPSLHNPEGVIPRACSAESDEHPRLTEMLPSVQTLSEVIDVDYALPGCPPPPEILSGALTALLAGTLPAKGSVLGDSRSLCHSCTRRETKPERLALKGFRRLYEADIDPTTCFYAQALICMGPATRGGCRGRCIQGNMPCRGCFGPLDQVADQGARLLSMIASSVQADSDEEVERLLDSIPDPTGLFYRYSLPSSILKGSASHGDS